MFSKWNWFICGHKSTSQAPKDSGLHTQEREAFEQVDYPVFQSFGSGLDEDGIKMGKSTLLKHHSFLFAFTEMRRQDDGAGGKESFFSIAMRRAPLPGISVDPDKLQWSPIMSIGLNLEKHYEVSTTSFVNSSKNQKMFIFVSLVKPRTSDPCIQWKVICASSTDCGKTWSEWENLTSVIKQMRPVGSKYFTVSPGHGIELQNGALMVFGRFFKSYDSFILNKNFQVPKEHVENEFDFENDISCSFFLTSHDFGENWILQNGPKGFVYATVEDNLLQMNDCNIVEYKPDCLFFLATARRAEENILVSSRSFNAGQNWDRAVPLIRNKPDRPEILTKFNLLEVSYNGYIYLIMCRCVRSSNGGGGASEGGVGGSTNIVLSASQDAGSKWSSSWTVRHNKTCHHVDMCAYVQPHTSAPYLVVLYEEQNQQGDVTVNYIHVSVKECLTNCLGFTTLN